MDSWNVLFLIYAVLSVGIEHGVHWIKTKVKGKKTLMLVIRKAEEELFLLGTVSFLLLVFENPSSTTAAWTATSSTAITGRWP